MKNFRSPCAVVLVNLGTPADLSIGAIRKFLAEFLGDPRVVEIPRPVWWIILQLFILPFRPRRLMPAYSAIWGEKGSPMRYITEAQSGKLQQSLDTNWQNIRVTHAMTYGEPAIGDVLQELYKTGHRRILVLPLYPQYSGSTTGAVYDQIAKFVSGRRALPGISVVNAYFSHPAFVSALGASIERFWEDQGRGEHLLFSYHGVPESYISKGDPYAGHCECTTAAVVDSMGLDEDFYTHSYQSRFGRAEWVKPYTCEQVVKLARAGVKRLDVICPAFAADCLETIEEIGVENRHLFIANGGEELRLIPCLNDSALHIEALEAIVTPYLRAFTGRA